MEKLEPSKIKGFNQKVVTTSCFVFKLLSARGDFSSVDWVLITFANSFDPDQARQIVGPDLDPNCMTP